MQYNNSQLEAINHIDGPALVLAGAGSGKTRVITGRIENLILNHGIKPTNILAVTFTNKAAGEMSERIYDVLKEKSDGLLCSTFHAFGVKILRENLKSAGLKYNFSIYTSSEQMMLVKKSMFALNIAEDMFDPRLVLWKMMKYKSQNLEPEQVTVIDPLGSVAKRVYANYKILLAESNAVDFEDLLLKPLNLLKNNKEILEKYQDHYRYILVDEFQDTNIVQYNMLKLLAGKTCNLFVVGDDDQSIYGFRGANFENILNFDKEWKNTKTIILNVNYRSNNTILTAANSVIINNKQRKPKDVSAHNKSEIPLEYFEGFDERNEAEKIAEKIKENLKNKKYSKFAVLMRANHQSRVLEEIFRAEQIPYNLVGGRKFYDRKEVKDIIAYFTILNNPSAEVAFLRIINTPKRGIGNETIFKISDFAKSKNISFFEGLKRYKEIKTIADSRHYNLKNFLDFLNKYMQKKEGSLFKHLTNFVYDSSYLTMLDNLSLPEKKIIDKKNSINELLNSVAEYERKVKKPSLNGFLERISLIQDSDTINSEEQVQIMTIHASKGLEFDTVFICGLEEGIFPHERSIEENNIEEERRLCYVALTRAENCLFLSSATSRNKYGKVEKSKQSRFIKEISKELFAKNPVKSDSEKISDAKDMIKSLLGL